MGCRLSLMYMPPEATQRYRFQPKGEKVIGIGIIELIFVRMFGILTKNNVCRYIGMFGFLTKNIIYPSTPSDFIHWGHMSTERLSFAEKENLHRKKLLHLKMRKFRPFSQISSLPFDLSFSVSLSHSLSISSHYNLYTFIHICIMYNCTMYIMYLYVYVFISFCSFLVLLAFVIKFMGTFLCSREIKIEIWRGGKGGREKEREEEQLYRIPV